MSEITERFSVNIKTLLDKIPNQRLEEIVAQVQGRFQLLCQRPMDLNQIVELHKYFSSFTDETEKKIAAYFLYGTSQVYFDLLERMDGVLSTIIPDEYFEEGEEEAEPPAEPSVESTPEASPQTLTP